MEEPGSMVLLHHICWAVSLSHQALGFLCIPALLHCWELLYNHTMVWNREGVSSAVRALIQHVRHIEKHGDLCTSTRHVVVCSSETPRIWFHSILEYLTSSWCITLNLISLYDPKKQENGGYNYSRLYSNCISKMHHSLFQNTENHTVCHKSSVYTMILVFTVQLKTRYQQTLWNITLYAFIPQKRLLVLLSPPMA